MTRSIVAALALAAALTGCGHSAPVAGHSLAQQACLSGGSQAASYAAQAAAQNPAYATLSADEARLAATDSQQASELSDGSSSDDSGLGALTQTTNLGTSGGIKVLTDCVSLGLSVTHH
jgi:hypothetical protein